MVDLYYSFLKILIAAILTLVLSIVVIYLEMTIRNEFIIVMMEELIKMVPIFIASTFIGHILLGSLSGFTIGVMEQSLRLINGYAFNLSTVLMHVSTSLILATGVYFFKRANNRILFSWVPILTLLVATFFHYIFNVYGLSGIAFLLSSIIEG